MSFELPKNEPKIEEYEKKFAGKNEITLEDLREMKEKGITTEDFLNHLGGKHGYFFHGSRTELSADDNIVAGQRKEIHASDNPAISIMKAIYSNKGVNLRYPFAIDEKHPLNLTIEGKIRPDTIGEKGYIYIIENSDEFENNPPNTWQYVKKGEEGQKFIKRVEIEKDDFKYPVEIEA